MFSLEIILRRIIIKLGGAIKDGKLSINQKQATPPAK